MFLESSALLVRNDPNNSVKKGEGEGSQERGESRGKRSNVYAA